jgi:dolichol-phosphate mannosyltransferase
MYFNNNWAVVIPVANEAKDLHELVSVLNYVLDKLESGRVYFIVDKASRDNTKQLCEELASYDPRYVCVWSPENRCVVDAYLRGYRTALEVHH